jgi:hypothetical protein
MGDCPVRRVRGPRDDRIGGRGRRGKDPDGRPTSADPDDPDDPARRRPMLLHGDPTAGGPGGDASGGHSGDLGPWARFHGRCGVETLIRRHLTNQRTDAVAMSVLDPLEVFEIEVWPLPAFQAAKSRDAAAKPHLDALERPITAQAVEKSQFKAILNDKDPPVGDLVVAAPLSSRARLVSDRAYQLRSHPDFRIAPSPSHLPPGPGDFRTGGPGRPSSGPFDPGQAPSVAGVPTVRGPRRRRLRPEGIG